MNESLGKRMEQMAIDTSAFCYCSTPGICHGCEEKTIKIFKFGFISCSKIYEAKLNRILNVSEDARSMAESIKQLIDYSQEIK